MLRRTLLVATIVLAIGGCATSDHSSQVAQAVTTSQSAADIVHALQAKFVLHYATPPSLEKLLADDDTPTPRTAAVLISSDVDQVQQTGARLSLTLKGGTGTTSKTLPDRAAGAIELSSGEAKARISLIGASSNAAGELGDGYIVYANGAPGGGHVLHLATKEGVEDFVTLNSAPQGAALEYSLELVSGIAGLRLVENTLELLDSNGSPRLRVRRPYLVDSTGKGVSASLSVSGCAVDANPRAPWGRAVTPPGASTCTVRVSWDNAKVTFPALLDPAWSGTGSMSEARADHTVTLLDDGRVLAACGVNAGPTQPGAELYDPSTGTWSTTGTPTQKRTDHVAAKLTNGKVLIAGGQRSRAGCAPPSSMIRAWERGARLET